jgi:hypothetical protein
MNNRVEEASLPAGTRIRVGRPADQPQDAIDALIGLFLTKDNVVSAGLGLMEIIYPNGTSEFTYTIGIECSSDEAGTIRQAIEVLQTVPTGRWPISVVPAGSQFFPKDAPVFFDKKTESHSWFHRLLHKDLGSLWAKRKTADQRNSLGTAQASTNQDLIEAIQRVVTDPSRSNRQVLYQALLRSHLFLGVQNPPEGLSGSPTTLKENTPFAMATSINPEGKEVLLTFSDRDSLNARNPSLGWAEMLAKDVLGIVVQNDLAGIVINPGGQWVELTSEEVKSVLASDE